MRGVLATFILLSLLCGITFYLSRRLYRGISVFLPGARFWMIAAVVIMMVIITVIGFGRAFMPFPKEVKSVFGLAGSCFMGVILYLLIFTVCADLLFALPRIFKLSFTTHRFFNGFVTVGVVAATALTCICGFVNANKIEHVYYNIHGQGKHGASDLKIVMISDLHLGAVCSEGRLEKIVSEINAKNPDLVCIAGDFFDTDFGAIQAPDKAEEKLRKISSKYGVYACLGNHDCGGTLPEMKDFLKRANIELLEDSYTIIENKAVLVGRLDSAPIGGYEEAVRKPFSEVVDFEGQLPVIVLDHNPMNIDEYASDADLVLCGHTHKGQIFPGNLITSSMYTVDYGYYRKDSESPHVVVSSGVGTWGMPMRVGSDCEIVTIEFCG